jgi:hypothetical protein
MGDHGREEGEALLECGMLVGLKVGKAFLLIIILYIAPGALERVPFQKPATLD